jgi:prevent-host-death family protein
MPRTIAHRELRNNSSQILREVEQGETFEITNHGEVVALLVPPPRSGNPPLRSRPARIHGGFAELRRVHLDHPIQEDIDYLRGER